MELLPIGSVVVLKNAEKTLMIIGVLLENAEGVRYDYVGCPYPDGFLDYENLFLFNHDEIAGISFFGSNDSEHREYMEDVAKSLNNLRE